MADINLPGPNLLQGYNVGANGSPGAAAAPWQALSGVGAQIQDVGEKQAGMLIRLKELSVKREAAEMELAFEDMRDGYELEVLQNPNMSPEDAVAGWQKRASQFQSKYQRDGMSPLEQDAIATRSAQLIQRGSAGVAKSSYLAGIQNSKQAAINLVNRAEQTGNMEMRDQGFSMLGEIMPEADLEAERMKSDRRVQTTQVEADIAADPIGMREKLKDPSFIKERQGLAVDDLPRLQDQARSASRQAVGDSVDSFGNDIATGKIKTADDIDRLYGHNPARIVEQMKGELAERYTDQRRLTMKSPEYQAKSVSEASTIISGLPSADSEDFEEGYAQASFTLGTLEDSPMKELLSNRLKSAKEGKAFEVKTKFDQGIETLKLAGERGDYGPLKKPEGKPIETRDAVADGFFKDTKKMQALGHSKENAEEIRDQAIEDPALGQAKFKELWKTRTQGSVNAQPFDIAVADAIMGGNGFLQWDGDIPQEAQDAHNSAVKSQGEAMIEFGDWMKMNPDAKDDAMGAKLRELGSKSARVAPTSGPVKAPPTRQQPGETSMNIPKDGIKLSNYGYSSDSTPDSFSAKGIGHKNNKLIPGESAAITKSLAVRLGLDHGDKVKIQTTKGDFTVFYHDTVPSSDKRTGPLPETIDIYRPQDGSNSWGGKVLKVSKI